jgi:hypothetical protein
MWYVKNVVPGCDFALVEGQLLAMVYRRDAASDNLPDWIRAYLISGTGIWPYTDLIYATSIRVKYTDNGRISGQLFCRNHSHSLILNHSHSLIMNFNNDEDFFIWGAKIMLCWIVDLARSLVPTLEIGRIPVKKHPLHRKKLETVLPIPIIDAAQATGEKLFGSGSYLSNLVEN